MNEQEYYQIPCMRISKEDIMNICRDKNNKLSKKVKKVIDDLTPEQMQELANKMQEPMMQNYWDALEEALEDFLDD
jgi:hypothetical protein